MSRLGLIYPSIGRYIGDKYVRSWQMQPLATAVLAGLTPPDWEVVFFDDRLEEIDYGVPADLVAISIETFTARRGYQIAAEFRKKGIPVVFGGHHATACPDEALEHGDAICVGEAEHVWRHILDDAKAGKLGGVYENRHNDMAGIVLSRDVFRGKNYFPIGLVETGRGCPFKCDFCSVSAFYQSTYRRRPVADVVAEIRALNEKSIFFVDDNVIGDVDASIELFDALEPLEIRWFSQASIDVAADEELLRRMVRSGCAGLLIGFESLDQSNLRQMSKNMNRVEDYRKMLEQLRRAGICVYGTFVFGYPNDTPELLDSTVRFAQEQSMFLAAFAHLVPFPGTPLYSQLEASERLNYDRWWLSDEYRFGQAPFHPQCMTAAELEERCHDARKRFYGMPSIARRGLDLRANCGGIKKAVAFVGANLMLQREVSQKRGLPLGFRPKVDAEGDGACPG